MSLFWQSGINAFTVDWWRQLWQQCAYLQRKECRERPLRADMAGSPPYAIRDRDMMAAEARK